MAMHKNTAVQLKSMAKQRGLTVTRDLERTILYNL